MTLDNRIATDSLANMEVTFDDETRARMRWQNSPLVHAINDVVTASRDHAGYQTGVNKATARIVGAADELRILHERIMVGDLDGLGYPITSEADDAL